MKNKTLISIILLSFLHITIANAKEEQQTLQPVDFQIKSPDIAAAVKESKEQKKYFKKVFVDSETEQVIKDNEIKADKSKNKIQQTYEQEPVIEAFGPPEKSDKLEASIQKIPMLSLDDCIKMALENNPTIRSSIANARIYKTKIGQAWSAYFPKLGAGIGYSRNKMLPLYFKPAVAEYNSWTMPTVSADWTIFDFGKGKAQVDIARKTHEATEESLQETINTTIYDVKSSFYLLLYAIQAEQVWQSSVEQYEISLEQAKAYYNIGTKPKIDVYSAEHNLSNAKYGQIRAKNDISLAYAQLNNAMGLPEYANYEIVDDLMFKKYNLNLNDLIKEALEVRPALLAAQKKKEASKYMVKSTYRAFLPNLTLSGNFTQGGLTANSGEYGYGFGGSLSYSPTNLMLLKKQVEEARATVDKESAEYEVTRQKVYLDVKKAYIELKNAKENIPVAQKAMKQAEEQYNMARGRYKVGLGDIIELKDAEISYRNAQLKYYRTLLDYNISAANLEKVVGTPIKAEEEVNL